MCLVIHLIFVDNPVGVFHIVGQFPYAIKQTILGAIVVQIVRHILLQRPAIQRCHGTYAAAVPQSAGGKSLVGL